MNDTLSNTQQSRETIECDVLIVGAGPAGLSAALKLKLQANDAGKELSIIVLDKELSLVLIFSVGQSWIPER